MTDQKQSECSLCASGDEPFWWSDRLWHKGVSTDLSTTLIPCTASEADFVEKGEPEDPPSE